MTLGVTVGVLIGTAIAGPAGAAIGGVLGGATESLTGDILTSLGTDAIVDTARETRRRWRPAQRVVSETIQSIFRAAVCEGLFDIGGSEDFAEQWQPPRDVPIAALYWRTESGQRLRSENRDLAERAGHCLRSIVSAAQDVSLFVATTDN